MSAIIKKLLLLSVFCFAIEAFRMFSTHTLNYIFLPFNLLLAWIPLGFALLAANAKNRVQLLAYLTGWLMFFPNAPCIITDLIHLKPRNYFPMWFDSILIYSFAFAGLVVGMLSAIIIYKKTRETLPVFAAKASMFLLMLISGYGIYLGRNLRFNSWEVITNPFEIFTETIACICHPTWHPGAYGMTLVTGTLLCIVFLMFDSLISTEEV